MNEQIKWQEAAKDPALLKDISEIEADFEFADAETAGEMYLAGDGGFEPPLTDPESAVLPLD
jgi:hypothetical protein